MAQLGAQLDIEELDNGFALVGEIDAHTAPLLDEALATRLTSGSVWAELDMSGVTFMDSSGLRVVIAATDAFRASGGDVTLMSMTSPVQRLIEMSGLGDHLSLSPPA